jgi:hypothetical protein
MRSSHCNLVIMPCPQAAFSVHPEPLLLSQDGRNESVGVSLWCRQVLGAACVGVVGYYGNQYYSDTAIQAAEWATLVLKHLLKAELVDLARPVTFFLIAASACLMNTLCLLIACTISPITALMVTRTSYVSDA